MKIKIPPYPSFKITDQAFNRDVVSNSVKKSDAIGLSNQLVLITEFKNGERRVIKSRPVKLREKIFITAFPNPVHLFLSVAIEHFNQSEEFKETNFFKCGKRYGDDIFLLDFEENGTHDCYNHYIKYRASSIIMLVSSIEAFLNHIIPNDFIYRRFKKEKLEDFNKREIESAKIPFKEKLAEVIPQWLGNEAFWTILQPEKESILELYENRRKIIHLKTNAQDDFDRYFKVIDKMLDLDIFASIQSTIKFMNSVSENFVKFETQTT